MEADAVSFSPVALNDLKTQVVHAFKSIPRRGAEGGGLLCGQIVEAATGYEIRIASVVAVPIEYKFGPNWRLSDSDCASFREALDRASPGSVIGWYRSHTRASDAPDDEDRRRSTQCFGDKPGVFLVCYPDAACNVPATLYLWKNGREEESVELQLGRYSLLDEALEAVAEEHTEMPVVEAPPAKRIAAPPLPRSVPRAIKIGLVFALSAAMVYATGLLWRNHSAAIEPTENSGLKAENQGASLLIGWNRQAPEIQQATYAAVRITDGSAERVIKLSRQELQSGSLLYSPRSEDIQLALEIHGASGDVTRTLRVIGAPMQHAETPQIAPAAFIAAHAIHMVRPPLTDDERSMAQQVRVDVTIDAHGSVRDARLNSATTDVADWRAAPVLEAAKRWKFDPAVLGTQPVQSRLTLRFDIPALSR